jgi:DNA-binding transcriptional regulator LsrR (DeoR family)
MARPKQVDKQLVEQIRTTYSSGDVTQQELAKRFGLSQSTICKIINNYIHRYNSLNFSGEAEVRVGYKHGN